MIQALVDRWEKHKEAIRGEFAEKHPDAYLDIVKTVVTHIADGESHSSLELDPNRIHVIDDGHYQGTLLFVVAGAGYQPSDYYSVAVSYGSCSGCDTLQAIRGYEDGPPSKEQVDDYMKLALHVVQGFRHIAGWNLEK